jgi:hypothetical protein
VAFIGGDVDMNQQNQVRAKLMPLVKAAQETGAAVLVVHHARKDSGGKAQHRAMGSADMANGVRSQIMVDQNADGQTILVHSKANWSRKGPTLLYTVDPDRGTLVWGGQWNGPVDGIVTVRPKGHARRFLVGALAGGPVAAVQLINMARDQGISERTLQRAKQGLVVSRKLGGGEWVWELVKGVNDVAAEGAMGSDGGDRVVDGAPGGPEPEPVAAAAVQGEGGGGVALHPEDVVRPVASDGDSGGVEPLPVDPVLAEAQRRLAAKRLREIQ